MTFYGYQVYHFCTLPEALYTMNDSVLLPLAFQHPITAVQQLSGVMLPIIKPLIENSSGVQIDDGLLQRTSVIDCDDVEQAL